MMLAVATNQRSRLDKFSKVLFVLDLEMINKNVSERMSKCIELIELACRRLPTVNRKTLTDCSINLFQFYFHTVFCETNAKFEVQQDARLSYDTISLENYAVGCAMVVMKGQGYNIDLTWNDSRKTGITCAKAVSARNQVYHKVAEDGALKLIGASEGIRQIERAIVKEKLSRETPTFHPTTVCKESFTLFSRDEWQDACNVIGQCVDKYGLGQLVGSRATKLYSVITAWDSGRFESKNLKFVALSCVILIAQDLNKSFDLVKMSKELIWGTHITMVRRWINITMDSIKRLKLDTRHYSCRPEGLLLPKASNVISNEYNSKSQDRFRKLKSILSEPRQHFECTWIDGGQRQASVRPTVGAYGSSRQHFKF